MILSVAGFRSTSEEAAYVIATNPNPRYPNAGCEWQLQGYGFVTSSDRSWAGRRLMPPTGDLLSHVSLLRHFKRVINFDFEISHRTFELGMAE
jgi:hypothetical protein